VSQDLREAKAHGSIGRRPAVVSAAARIARRDEPQKPVLSVLDRPSIAIFCQFIGLDSDGRSPDKTIGMDVRDDGRWARPGGNVRRPAGRSNTAKGRIPGAPSGQTHPDQATIPRLAGVRSIAPSSNAMMTRDGRHPGMVAEGLTWMTGERPQGRLSRQLAISVRAARKTGTPKRDRPDAGSSGQRRVAGVC